MAMEMTLPDRRSRTMLKEELVVSTKRRLRTVKGLKWAKSWQDRTEIGRIRTIGGLQKENPGRTGPEIYE
jgi:hypothetical protein